MIEILAVILIVGPLLFISAGVYYAYKNPLTYEEAIKYLGDYWDKTDPGWYEREKKNESWSWN